MASKIQNTGRTAPQATSSSVEIEEPIVYTVPSSSALNLVTELFNMGEKAKDEAFLKKYPTERKGVSHSSSYKVRTRKTSLKVNGKPESRRSLSIEKSSEDEYVRLVIPDIGAFTRSNKPLKKIFMYTLMEAARQSLYHGQLVRDYVSYPLSDFLSINAYSTLRGAEKGFHAAVAILTTVQVWGYVLKRSRKKEGEDEYEMTSDLQSDNVSSPFRMRNLFIGAELTKDGQCRILLNPYINWNFIVQYYDILPLYYFSLTNRASDLLEYIFYLARQNCGKIAKGEPFNIGLRAIQQRLQLPSEKYVNEKGESVFINNPKRDIKDAITSAMSEIMAAHKAQKEYDATDLEMSLLGKHGKSLGHWDEQGNYVLDSSLPISDFLDNGYLQIKLGGVFAEKLSEIQKTTEKKIESAKKRKEDLIERATVKYLADKMKEADKEKKGDAAETSDTESSEE